MKSLPKKEQAGCTALEGQAFCTKLLPLRRKYKISLWKRSANSGRAGQSRCWTLCSHGRKKNESDAAEVCLGKALHYLKEQRPYLVRYLEDGRLEISNNRAERSIKPFVMGRKNWLFANTPAGARASAVIYSLMETAKETGLDPYKYLLWALAGGPKLFETDREWAKKADSGTLYTTLS